MIYPDQFVLLMPYALLAGLLCFAVGYACGVREKEKNPAGQSRIKQ